MNHSIDFFRDEIRNGFYIPTAIKQSWASSLDVLSVIDAICKKNGITYFADWGTLLGAVRHGGFVPWDDDLDICMKRDDYVRFRAVADQELPPEFVIHDYERQENHWLFLSRVVNNSRISFNEAYLNSHYNFPWLTGVDIFVKDYLYKNPEDEKKRCNEIMEILAVAEGVISDSISSSTVEHKLQEYTVKYSFSFPTEHRNARQLAISLYKLAEIQMSRVPAEKSDSIGQIFPWIMKGGIPEPKSYYESAVWLPFEDSEISVPSHYNEVLSHRYGNYNEIHKVWDGHTYPAFDNQRKNFEDSSGVKLPGFSFPAETTSDIISTISPENNSLHYHSAIEKGSAPRRAIVFLPIGPREWNSLAHTYEKGSADQNADIFVVPLPLMFKDFSGNVTMSDEEILAASKINEYPDNLPLYDWTSIDLEAINPDVIYIQTPYDEYNPCLTVPGYFYSGNLCHLTKKLIYIPIGPTSDFTEKDVTDQITLDFHLKNPALFYADEVWVQSENMKKQYVNKLEEYTKSEATNYWDKKIIAKRDLYSGEDLNIKNSYPIIDSATESANTNRDTTHIGIKADSMQQYGSTNSIAAKGNSAVTISSHPKSLLYCISSYEATEHADRLLDALKERLEIFKQNESKISVTLCAYPPESGSANEFIELAAASGLSCDFITYGLEDAEYIASIFDAYYGSSSPLVPEFVAHKKPVMISNYEL